MKEFDNKTRCDIYVPLETNNDENFLVELLELCECYLEPIKYGIKKEDVVDLVECEKKGISLIDFLKFKRYITDNNCFLDIAQKYMTKTECLKIIFENVNYNDIECFFADYSISEIRNRKIIGYIQQVGKINSKGEFEVEMD